MVPSYNESLNGARDGLATKKARSSVSGQVPVPCQARLIVIGAGFAGLCAARTVQAGAGDRCEVILLEASNMIGGRARAGTLPSGAQVELGATWFHGIQGNPLYDIAVWEGLVRDLRGDPDLNKHHVNWQVDFARPQCPDLLAGHFREIAEEALERFQESAMDLSEGSQASEPSVGAYLRRKFDEAVKSHGYSSEELAVFAESWLFREKQQRTFDGFYCADDVSTAFPWEFETLEGPNLPVPGGLQAIATSLASSIDIRFGHKVTAIEWGSGGVCITCSNGVVLEADAVLVTTSIGVLQAQHQTMFQPPLPEWKKEALSAMRLGVADKIFVEFDIDLNATNVAGPTNTLSEVSSSPMHMQAAVPPQTCSFESASPSSGGIPISLSSIVEPTSYPCDADMMSSDGCSSSSSVVQLVTKLATAEEPWNMGRRMSSMAPGTQSAAQAAAAVGSGHTPTPMENGPSGSKRSSRPLRRRKSIRTYAFLWPVPDPMALGSQGQAQAIQLLPGGLTHNPSVGRLGSGLPSWLYGLHSVRYSPGPDWIEPSEKDAFQAMIDRLGGLRDSETKPPQKSFSAVVWITGDAALEMEALPDSAIQAGIVQLFRTFPSVPLPPGAKLPPRILRTCWGSDELFRGSYSYLRAGVDDGEAIDVIAQPLFGGSEDGSSVMPVVMFAGEATHRQYPGTAHGAYMSGYREANRFLAALEQSDSMAAWGRATASHPESSVAQQQH